ncbi:alpha/beta hydrolase [Sinomicrobium soli]|nr:alpha/beta hydrolase [Sinomicrobium sp. N-1-3-6]
MPGMAASPLIFEHIELPTACFEVFRLEWIPPLKGESLKDYARRMSRNIRHPDPVLIGVSFGGMLVQEMAPFVNPRKLIIISSVKTRDELPGKMKFAHYTGVHKLLPTSLVTNVEFIARYAFGKGISKRLKRYEKYLAVKDKDYVDWAINEIVHWKRTTPVPGIIHIHGDKDPVFPISCIKECIRVKGGTHIMIINRSRWFNEHLPSLIEN